MIQLEPMLGHHRRPLRRARKQDSRKTLVLRPVRLPGPQLCLSSSLLPNPRKTDSGQLAGSHRLNGWRRLNVRR
jgi:hypothetical protein